MPLHLEFGLSSGQPVIPVLAFKPARRSAGALHPGCGCPELWVVERLGPRSDSTTVVRASCVPVDRPWLASPSPVEQGADLRIAYQAVQIPSSMVKPIKTDPSRLNKKGKS